MKKQLEQLKTGTIIKKIDEFQALSLAMFLLNERITFKDFITNRYKIIDYTSKSFITNEAIAEFNEKYVLKHLIQY